MRVRAIIPFTTARGEIPAGSILNIPDHLLGKLAGKVEALTPDAPQKATHSTSEQLSIIPTTCQAKKILPGGGYRICGALLREGINGFLSCSSPFCQVPVKNQ